MRRCSGLIAALALTLAGSSARADLLVEASEDGGAYQTIVNVVGMPSAGIQGLYTQQFGDFRITFLGTEADTTVTPGGTLAELLSSTTKVTNVASSNSLSPAHTLSLMITASGFTAPTTPPTLQLLSHVGATVSVPSAVDALAFQSSVSGQSLVYTPGPQLINMPGSGSYNSDASTLVPVLAAPYNLSETLSLTLGNGSTANFSASTTLNLAPVPEPSALVLVSLGGFTLLGLSARRRVAAAKV